MDCRVWERAKRLRLFVRAREWIWLWVEWLDKQDLFFPLKRLIFPLFDQLKRYFPYTRAIKFSPLPAFSTGIS
jgi:hypothetical protein